MARPPFKPTAVHRRKVAAAAGGGMTQDAIATALGISKPTLAKHFAAELVEGACQKRLDVLDALYRTAMKGNVSAQRAYLATNEPRGVAPPADVPKPKRGKKEQANDDAKTAANGTSWGQLLDFPPAKQPRR